MTDGCKSFVVVTFGALVVDVALVDEAAAVVPHFELVVILVFDAVAAHLVDVFDSSVVIAFHLAVHLDVVAMLSPLDWIEVHINVVILFLPCFEEVLTKFAHLMEQL